MHAPVLVTGGAGCIGIQVVRELDRRGIEVHVLDLGEQIVRVRQAIPKRVKVFYGSILDVSSIRKAMDGCGSVIHLAAYYSFAGGPSPGPAATRPAHRGS